jgi:prophage antirepressor-like protein
MNEIQLFNNERFGQIRSIVKEDGSIWFVGNDVAQALGYERPRKAILDHCKGGCEMGLPSKTGRGGKQKTKIINEPDLYRLIFNSKMEEAIKFQDWVFEKVLPEIRKTGEYKSKHNNVIYDSIYARLEETDAIKRLLEVAIDEGSTYEQYPERLFSLYTEYVYKAYYDNYNDYRKAVTGLTKEEKNLKQNLRNSDNTYDLIRLTTLEQITANVINRELDNGLYYKDVKYVVQDELKKVTDLLGTNKITNKELPSKCKLLLK